MTSTESPFRPGFVAYCDAHDLAPASVGSVARYTVHLRDAGITADQADELAVGSVVRPGITEFADRVEVKLLDGTTLTGRAILDDPRSDYGPGPDARIKVGRHDGTFTWVGGTSMTDRYRTLTGTGRSL